MSRLLHHKITPKSSVPDIVSVEEVKSYCRVDFNDDDSLFERLIRVSRERLEAYTSRVFLLADCEATYVQEGCGDRISLAYSDNIQLPNDSVYKDALVGDKYIDTTDRKLALTYEAGYAADAVPEWMKQAIIMDVAYRYENRGEMPVGASGINTELKEFLRPYVNWSFL